MQAQSKMTSTNMRDLTHNLSKTLEAGGEVLVMKKNAPWRYIQIREVEVKQNGSEEENQERQSLKEESGKKKVIINK
jgi:hypothetical protein